MAADHPTVRSCAGGCRTAITAGVGPYMPDYDGWWCLACWDRCKGSSTPAFRPVGDEALGRLVPVTENAPLAQVPVTAPHSIGNIGYNAAPSALSPVDTAPPPLIGTGSANTSPKTGGSMDTPCGADPLLPQRLELTAREVDQGLQSIARQLLVALGEDPARPGLLDTPRRWAAMWQEFAHHQEQRTDTTFDAPEADQLVGVRQVRVWSFCEHHLLPFWCDLAMAYVPAGKVLGLSKFARIARQCASKLQLQERLVQEIADYLAEVTGSEDVAVKAVGEHLCMSMRGARQEDARMVSSVLYGRFRSDLLLRQEWMQLAGAGG